MISYLLRSFRKGPNSALNVSSLQIKKHRASLLAIQPADITGFLFKFPRLLKEGLTCFVL